VAVDSQICWICVVPEELAIDVHPSSVVGFSEEVYDGMAEGGMGEFAGFHCKLGFRSSE
jgi:hypothetical protein